MVGLRHDQLRETSRAGHNGFHGLICFQGKWICSLREAPAHRGGVVGFRIRLLTSSDGVAWENIGALSDMRDDIRSVKRSVILDGRLMVITAIQLRDTSSQKHQSLAFFSQGLHTWEGSLDVGESDYWMWGITWHDGVG
jgi:hypothetical protein